VPSSQDHILLLAFRQLRVLLEKIIPEHRVIDGYEVEHDLPVCASRKMMRMPPVLVPTNLESLASTRTVIFVGSAEATAAAMRAASERLMMKARIEASL
jgi:hypothetical protein